MTNNIKMSFKMELVLILALSVIVKLKRMEGVLWWFVRFVIINGAGFVDIRRICFFIKLLTEVYANFLIIVCLDLSLINKISSNVQDFFCVLLFFFSFLCWFIYVAFWFSLFCLMKNSNVSFAFLVIQGLEKRVSSER